MLTVIFKIIVTIFLIGGFFGAISVFLPYVRNPSVNPIVQYVTQYVSGLIVLGLVVGSFVYVWF